VISEFYIEQVNPNDANYKVVNIYIENFKKISAGDILFDLEGQKATIEIHAEVSGYFYTPYIVGGNISCTDVAYFICKDFESCVNLSRSKNKINETSTSSDVINDFPVKTIVEPLAKLNNPSVRVAILPGGRAFRQIQDAVHNNPYLKVVGYFDDADRLGPEYLGNIDVDSIVKMYFESKFDRIFVACGSSELRTKLINVLSKRGLKFINIIHPSAFISNDATLGCNIYVGPFAQIASKAIVEDGVFISASANIEHHCHVSENCLFGPGVLLSGGVKVGKRTMLGAGVSVESNISIGDDVYVAPGKGITKNIKSSARIID